MTAETEAPATTESLTDKAGDGLMDRLGDFLSHEVFTTGVSLLELIVSIVTLMLGGYAGARIGALARMRNIDRRTLLDNILPGLQNLETPSWERPHHPLIDLVETSDAITDLLPWLDRREWDLLRTYLPMSEAEQRSKAWTSVEVAKAKRELANDDLHPAREEHQRRALAATTRHGADDYRADLKAQAAESREAFEQATRAKDNIEAELADLRTALEEADRNMADRVTKAWGDPNFAWAIERFQHHLHYRLRPSPWRRLKLRGRCLSVLWRRAGRIGHGHKTDTSPRRTE